MTVTEIRKIARTQGIKIGKLRKGELIKAIQIEENNFPCFGTPLGSECDQADCSWRGDCLKPVV